MPPRPISRSSAKSGARARARASSSERWSAMASGIRVINATDRRRREQPRQGAAARIRSRRRYFHAMHSLFPLATTTRWAFCLTVVASIAAPAQPSRRDTIPLPEHPRPDFERAEWVNLNGWWSFAFDARDDGIRAGWPSGALPAGHRILVPFSWGAPLSGVPDSANIAWYARTITVPSTWRGRRVFVVFGASDWQTSAWLDGRKIGEHQGGYTPFSFELKAPRFGRAQRLVVRVDDTPHAFKLEGKQGYGAAHGMWQTVYLEARGGAPLDVVHFTPHADLNGVRVEARLLEPAPTDATVRLTFTNRAGQPSVTQRISRGQLRADVDVPLPDAHRWSLDDPFLHDVV